MDLSPQNYVVTLHAQLQCCSSRLLGFSIRYVNISHRLLDKEKDLKTTIISMEHKIFLIEKKISTRNIHYAYARNELQLNYALTYIDDRNVITVIFSNHYKII